jgi:hypothetical protein
MPAEHDAAPDRWERAFACAPIVGLSMAWLGFALDLAVGQPPSLGFLCLALFLTGLLVGERWSDPYGC